ncbi:MAG: pilus assembly protein TadG-related protein [Pseudomonadota bacterium]
MIWASLKSVAARRRKGAIAFLAVVALIPVSAMLAASMNAGQMTNDRRHLQDGADAIALMHGAWSARSLNAIAMNNVTATQLATVAVGSEALAGTIQEQINFSRMAMIYIGAHAAIHCPPRSLDPYTAAAIFVVWTIPCGVWHYEVAQPAKLASDLAKLIDLQHQPDHGIHTAQRGLRSIDGMNEEIIGRFPRAVGEMASEYASRLGFDTFYFADPCNAEGAKNCNAAPHADGMALPLEIGGWETSAEFCAAMQLGTPVQPGIKWTSFSERGFPTGKGPMAHGGAGNKTVRKHIQDTSNIQPVLNGFKTFYDSPLSVLPRYLGIGVDKHPKVANLWLGQSQTNNSFTRRFDIKYATVCLNGDTPLDALPIPPAITEGIGSLLEDLLAPVIELVMPPLYLETELPTLWKLKDISPLSVPPALTEDMPEAFHILALTEKAKSRRLASGVLTDNVSSHFAYGQVGLFNPDGADLYSQNWRYRMMPATRADDPAALGQEMMLKAPAAFNPIATGLGAVTDTASWERIHAH